MQPTRSVVAAGLFLFGMSFLWYLPHFLRPGTRPEGAVWLVIQVLVAVTVVVFAMSTWAVFRGLSWWLLVTAVASILGVITSVLWWSAAASTIGAADAAVNALLHLAGSVLIGGAVLVPSVKANLDNRFRTSSAG
jgi:hypothetical protein